VSDVSTSESDGIATFNVDLIPEAEEIVTVNYATSDDTASEGLDYSATSGSLLFNIGERTKQIDVPIIDDGDEEPAEKFNLTLTDILGAEEGDSVAVGTILANDSLLACGEPDYDLSVDRAIFVWRDCATELWNVRASAGSGWIRFNGVVTSDMPLTNQEMVSLELKWDIFDTSNPNAITWEMELVPPWYDGFNFNYPNGANVCFDITNPGTPEVYIGPDRTPITTPFNMETLEPC